MVFGVNLFPNKKEVNLNFFFDFIGFDQATQTGEKNRCRMCVILFDSFFFFAIQSMIHTIFHLMIHFFITTESVYCTTRVIWIFMVTVDLIQFGHYNVQ